VGEEAEDFDLVAYPEKAKAVLEEWLATRAALVKAADTGALSTYRPQPYQLPFHQSEATNRWFFGANRTGKTLVCYNEVRWFALGSHPYRKVKPAKLIWICCPTEELARLIHFPAIEAVFGPENIEKRTLGAHLTIRLKNGCMIVFKYYAQGKQAFPSAGVDLVFCDEEPPWPVFQEIWSRRSTGTLNIIGANTAVNGHTWIWEKIVEHQLPSTEWWVAKLDDNQFIPISERELMKEGLRNDPTMYAIRVEGKMLPVGGGMRFNEASMTYYNGRVREPKVRLAFDMDHGRWVQNPTGELWIWEMPEKGHEYGIGVDVSEGLNVSYNEQEPVWDSTSCQIFNRHTRQFDAEYTAGNVEPGHIGQHILPRLSTMYNDAKANVELNLHGFTVVSHAKERMSSRLWSPTTDPAAWAEKPLRKYGTLLSSGNRRYLIDTFAQIVHERSISIPSGHLVLEMLNLVRKENGRVEHREGYHDDRVFAAGHALMMDRKLPKPRKLDQNTEQTKLRKWALESEKGRRPDYFKVIA
jgi:hypothetical protein